MNALFFILLTLFLMILQTVILPSFSFFMQCFDLLIIVVLFMCLVSSHYSTIFGIAVIGIIMDSISGVPFFYHLFSYVWVYIIVYLVRQFLFQKSILFILIMSIVSVGIQHLLLLFSIFVRTSGQDVLAFDFSLLIRQLFWGFIVIPPSIWFVSGFRNYWLKTGLQIQRRWRKAHER